MRCPFPLIINRDRHWQLPFWQQNDAVHLIIWPSLAVAVEYLILPMTSTRHPWYPMSDGIGAPWPSWPWPLLITLSK
jgi:hypothetical protein